MIEDPLELENRRKIFDLIRKRPGTHVREIEKELGLHPGVLTFHLDVLRKNGLVTSDDDGYKVRYFPSKSNLQGNRRTVSLIREPRRRKIVQLLLRKGSTSFQELQSEVGVSKSTLSYHLKKLVEGKVLIAERIDKEMFYRTVNPDDLVRVLLLMDSGGDSKAEGKLAEIWQPLISQPQ